MDTELCVDEVDDTILPAVVVEGVGEVEDSSSSCSH